MNVLSRSEGGLSEVEGCVREMEECVRKLTAYFGEEETCSSETIFSSILKFIQVPLRPLQRVPSLTLYLLYHSSPFCDRNLIRREKRCFAFAVLRSAHPSPAHWLSTTIKLDMKR